MKTEAALQRIYRLIVVIGVLGCLWMWRWKGWEFAVAFGVGAAVSGLNFHWIKGAADLLASKFSLQPNAEPPKRVAAKFILRYALIGIAGYVMFVNLRVSLPAFAGGLLVLAAAILAEMIYELGIGILNGT